MGKFDDFANRAPDTSRRLIKHLFLFHHRASEHCKITTCCEAFCSNSVPTASV